MNNELLLLNKKDTDTPIEQTKAKPQETLDFKLNEEIESFSFNPPLNFSEEGKLFIAVTSTEAANSVFIIIDENNSFPKPTPGHWNSEGGVDFFNKLNNLLEP